MAEIVVQLEGVNKIFKDFWGRRKAYAVKDLEFEIKQGEVFGLLGPNGSGKSTTIKMILGLLYPSRGRIAVFGKSPSHVETKSRIGYLPEETNLYRYLNSDETLDFYSRLFNLDRGTRIMRGQQLLEMVGLLRARGRNIGEYSKGMARRVGLAQALVNDPDLVILDEPTSGMDPVGTREIKDLIIALAKRGKTVILSSHLLSDVEDVCDRVAILYGGKLQALGPVRDLLTRKDNTRITAPLLSEAAMQKIVDIIRSETREDVIVDKPTETLENFFLRIVQKARQENQETSGAAAGGAVANFLATQPGSRLEQLTKSQPAPTPAEMEARVQDQLKSAQLVKSQEKLRNLTSQEPSAATAQEKLEGASAPAEVPRIREDVLKRFVEKKPDSPRGGKPDA